ncbi:DUF6236 family protein [Providencia alcalifaciens]|uniref:DUF6236 family protein n=1 Tax=Providencia TaxID=586 RepID=UPI0019803044|nr:DUF6236 family protein [Providencia rettgeri]MBN6350403.1 hypothetical protein [Providencia rettgeri]
MKRGIVTSSDLISKVEGGFRCDGVISPVEINYLTLYWDKIIIPDGGVIKSYIHEEDDLINCDILERPRHISLRGFNSAEYPKLQLKWLENEIDIQRKKSPSIDWRIHQFGGDINLYSGEVKNTARLELSNLLPVPSTETNLHEILEFKERRKAELEALHSYSDDLYLEILNSGDPNLAKAKAMFKLKQAISDIDKLNNEGWRSPIRFNLQISNEVDIAKIKSLYLTVVGAATTGHPLESLIVGGLCTFLEGFVSLKVGFQSVRSSKGNELIYLSNARKENII